MLRHFLSFALVFAVCLPVMADDVVFKSDVALTRVDVQVLDRDGHAITGLQVNDFILKVDGHVQPIRNFVSENMPIDILFLLDVSGSMQPHIKRIASAAEQALNVLADKDRIAIMVFDTSTRVRLPFASNHSEVTKELNHILRSEGFNRGTQITRAMISAADYVKREARPDARRAIVILTDDQTQDDEDETRVENSLAQANAVLSFLQAPYELPGMNGGGGHRRGTWGGGGGGWPGGGGIGFPGGGGPIGMGRRGGYGGRDRSHSAGTADIARDSGGDTIQVQEASALEDTLAKLRQRYTLHFNVADAAKSPDQTSVKVELAEQARIRYHDAELHSRRVFLSGGSSEHSGPTVVTRVKDTPSTSTDRSTSTDTQSSQDQSKRRRVAVNDDSGPIVNTVPSESTDTSSQSAQPSSAPATPAPQPAQKTGWPRAQPQQTQPPQL